MQTMIITQGWIVLLTCKGNLIEALDLFLILGLLGF